MSRYRSNSGVDTADSDSAEVYYRRNTYYPFLDHCVAEFAQRFPDSADSMFTGYKLLPKKVSNVTTKDLEAIEKQYGPDMPDRQAFQAEAEVWKTHCAARGAEKCSVLDALQLANADFFPNVHEVFKLILTLPIGSVPCEH